MPPAPIPSNELARLAALRRYQVLDSDPEESFDRLARTARTVFDVPCGMVSFVDTDRQWYKARIGVETSQTSRDAAFCAHTILSPAPLVVLDAVHDERFKDSPLVTCENGVRFYAGAPICTSDGHNVGVLCVTDQCPHDTPPTVGQMETLQSLAAMVADELQLRRTVLALNEALEQRIAAEQALALSEQRLKDFLETASDWLWETDEDHRFASIMANDRFALVGPPFIGHTRCQRAGGDPDTPQWAAHHADLAARRPFKGFRYSVADAAGRTVHVSVSGRPLFDFGGAFRGYRGTGRDITARVEADATIRDLSTRLSLLSTSGVIGMTVWEQDRLVEANDEFLRIIGLGQSDIAAGLSWSDLQPQDPAAAACGIATAPNGAGRFETEFLHTCGAHVPVSVIWVTLDVTKQSRMALIKDISERKASEAQIQELAFRDALTGLLNRRSFAEKLAARIAGHGCNDKEGALLLVDLDYFKYVNDTFGHDAGDALLGEIGKRLQDAVRHDDLVARIGGDEFAVVLGGVSDRRVITATAERIIDSCQAPVRHEGCEILVGASIGVAVFPEDGIDPAHLLKNADIALYRAKAGGRSTMSFFSRSDRHDGDVKPPPPRVGAT